MKKLLLSLILTTLPVFATAHGPFHPSSVEVWFSPKGGCTEACVCELDAAKKTIYVQAYSFTSAPIAKALVAAAKRGVKIEAILDKSQRSEKYTEADFIAHAGIPTYIDPVHAIAHNKVMIIDGATVITGSFNFTKAAEEKNAENLVVIRDSDLARRYFGNWNDHKSHSELYASQQEAIPTPALTKKDATALRGRPKIVEQRAPPIIFQASPDSLGVSCGAQFSVHGAYLNRLVETVQMQWQRILIESGIQTASGTQVRVKFRLDSSGAIAQIISVEGTAGKDAEKACTGAITARAPYDPWTDDMRKELGDSQEVSLTFYNN